MVFDKVKSPVIENVIIGKNGKEAVLELSVPLKDNNYQIEIINPSFSLTINDTSHSNFVKSISYVSLSDKNYLKIDFENLQLIEMCDQVCISYDKELLSAEYRLIGENDLELRSFTNYKTTNTSTII